jgi:transposase
VTHAFVAALSALVAQIHALDTHIAAQLREHTDAHLFLSLPRAQALRAARLLSEIGDCRARFPTPESLASLAGVTPSTRQSGKMRWSDDKQLRDAVCDFAADSRHANPWAAHLYNQARARGHRHPHAVRIVARAWLHVIWRYWQDHQPYDPTRHNALLRVLEDPTTTAARSWPRPRPRPRPRAEVVAGAVRRILSSPCGCPSCRCRHNPLAQFCRSPGCRPC